MQQPQVVNLLGSVSTVQAGCDRRPAQLYCNRSNGTELSTTGRTGRTGRRSHIDFAYQQVQASLGGLCCCHHQRSSTFLRQVSQVLTVPVRGVSLMTHHSSRAAKAYAARLAAANKSASEEDPPWAKSCSLSIKGVQLCHIPSSEL